MKETLLEKIKSWTYEKALEFHNDKFLYKDYIWEYTEDGVGVYLYAESEAWYFDNRSGKVYRLDYRYSRQDYDILSKLSKLNEVGVIKFDIPLEHSWVYHKDKFLEYTEYYRPNRQLGYTFLEYIGIGTGGKTVEEELVDYIEYTSKTIELFLDLNLEFPSGVFTISNVNVDQKGMFWTNLNRFELEYDDFLLRNFKGFSNDLITISRTIEIDILSIAKMAEKSWRK
jgi:hypothetical protein